MANIWRSLAVLMVPLVMGVGQPTVFADPTLSDNQVMEWFDTGLAGNPVRADNEVTALIDGPETFASMAAAIKAVTAADTGSPKAASLSVVRHFGVNPDDPIWPRELCQVAEGQDGSLYTSATSGLTTSGQGAVFKVTPEGKLTVLYKFDVTHGAAPKGGLTRGSDGNFYGTTYGGGKYATGTVFKITPAGQLTVLWDFRNGTIVPPPVYPNQPTEQQKLDAAGSYPISAPVQGKDGAFYGVTTYANNQQYGVLYRITASGDFRGIYFFKGDAGLFPTSLTAGADGNLYGTTLKGNATCPYGTVFRATPGGGVSTLYKFDITHGSFPYSLIQGKDGNLYGTTSAGGAANMGVLYKLSLAGEMTVLLTFGGPNGATPIGGLVQGTDGKLYGTTRYGGPNNRGIIYRINTDGKEFTMLYNFDIATGLYCVSPPMQHSNGKFYGVTWQGGSKNGGELYCLDVGLKPAGESTAFVYLLGWWLTDSFPLLENDSASTTRNLFTDAARNGAQVRAMLWDQVGTQNSAEVDHINALPDNSGAAILDNRTLNLGSHHQKILLVNGADGLTAFCGGVDINPDRTQRQGGDGSPLHDVHLRIRGPAAGDLLNIFTRRWQDHPGHETLDQQKGTLRGASLKPPDPIAGATHFVQVGRTYGNGSAHPGIPGSTEKGGYSFAPAGEQSAARILLHAIGKAQQFIYIEDQYFVDTAPNAAGVDVRAALIAALPRLKHVTILIPHGSISDMPQVNYRRQRLIAALKAAAPGKVRVFYRKPVGETHSYVHAKVWIFDDRYAIIGSVNTNRRSWTHDSEVVAGVCDRGNGSADWLPRRIRMRLWAEHLGVTEAQVRDAVASADLWLNPMAGAAIEPYDENAGIEIVHTDTAWDSEDPDGS